MIDDNYINVMGGGLTEFFNEFNKYQSVTYCYCAFEFIALMILQFVNPVIAGFKIILFVRYTLQLVVGYLWVIFFGV